MHHLLRWILLLPWHHHGLTIWTVVLSWLLHVRLGNLLRLHEELLLLTCWRRASHLLHLLHLRLIRLLEHVLRLSLVHKLLLTRILRLHLLIRLLKHIWLRNLIHSKIRSHLLQRGYLLHHLLLIRNLRLNMLLNLLLLLIGILLLLHLNKVTWWTESSRINIWSRFTSSCIWCLIRRRSRL